MRARILANIMIAVLERLTEGQGYASAGVFDAGAGGGFQTGDLVINLERDGLTVNQKRYTRKDFADMLTFALKGRQNFFR